MPVIPIAFALESCRGVIAVARQSDAPIAQVAGSFGISESSLQRWLKLDHVEEGRHPDVSHALSTELSEAKKR